jgi:sucrose-6-phosphate hydrolase SacC (GH32 family)
MHAADKKLLRWVKQDAPFLELPPAHLPLTGWRDPFVIQRGSGTKDWILLIGAGLKDKGGTTLIYRAKDLAAQWQYDGLLCTGEPSQGAMWECPLLWSIPNAPNPETPGFTDHVGGILRIVSDSGSMENAASAIAVTTGSDIFAEPSSRLQVLLPYIRHHAMHAPLSISCVGYTKRW